MGKRIFPLAFFSGFLLLGIYSYLGAFLYEKVGLNYLQVGIIMMLFGVSCFLAGPWIGMIGGKMGYKQAIAGGAILAAVPVLLFMTFPGWWQDVFRRLLWR